MGGREWRGEGEQTPKAAAVMGGRVPSGWTDGPGKILEQQCGNVNCTLTPGVVYVVVRVKWVKPLVGGWEGGSVPVVCVFASCMYICALSRCVGVCGGWVVCFPLLIRTRSSGRKCFWRQSRFSTTNIMF